MLDVDSVWTSQSWLENLQALEDAFYNLFCHRELWSVEEVRKLDDKHYFAFSCEHCGQMHAERIGVWAEVASSVMKDSPSEDHPEYEEFQRRRKEFVRKVKHIDVRDFAEPYLRASSEGVFIEGAVQFHQQVMDEYHAFICGSTLELGVTPDNALVAFFCTEHAATHYLKGADNNFYRRQVIGSHIPPQFVEHLSKLGQRVVLRDINFAFRKFDAAHPSEKVANKAVAAQTHMKAKIAAEEKAERRRLHTEAEESAKIHKDERLKNQKMQEEQASQGKEEQRSNSEEKVKALLQQKTLRNIQDDKEQQVTAERRKLKACKRIEKAQKKNKKNSDSKRKYNYQTSTVDDPRLYILPPHLMSEEWLVEYQVCGRKVAHSSLEEAQVWKDARPLEMKEGYNAYACAYCSLWHWGRQRKPSIGNYSSKRQAKAGLLWYKSNHKKANIFIHRLMFEESSVGQSS